MISTRLLSLQVLNHMKNAIICLMRTMYQEKTNKDVDIISIEKVRTLYSSKGQSFLGEIVEDCQDIQLLKVVPSSSHYLDYS